MFSEMKKSSINKVTNVCMAVANGDFEARIIDVSETGDVGEMMHAINLVIDRTDAYLRESKACLGYVGRNQHLRLIAERGMVGNFRDAARTINTALFGIKQRHDGFCELAEKFENQLKDIVEAVSTSVDDLNMAAKNVTDSSNRANEQSLAVASGADQASANMQGVAASTEELTSSIGEINRQVIQSVEIAASAASKSGVMTSEIEALSGASQKIGEVMKLINDIAAQTNLLALNATVEAARAGDAGRGFAIVAQEVKALAGQTANATEDISAQINGLQEATTRAVSVVGEIGEAIDQVSETTAAIASAMDEQNAATGETSRNVEEAANSTANVTSGIATVQETAQTTEKVMNSSRILSEQESSLQKLRGDMDTFLAAVTKVGY